MDLITPWVIHLLFLCQYLSNFTNLLGKCFLFHLDEIVVNNVAVFINSLCRTRNKIMYVLSWRTFHAFTGVLFWCLFSQLQRLLLFSDFCFDICNYICLDTSDHFSVFPASVFFIFSSTLVLSSSIDVVFLLSIHTKDLVSSKISISGGR